MAVEKRKTSRFWYGRWQRDGRRILKRLSVEVAGRPGSQLFKASKAAAEEELARLIRDYEANHRPEDLVQRVHELRFGRKVGKVPLKELAGSWEKLPRRKAVSKARLTYGRRVLGDFVRHVGEHYPSVVEMAAVTPEIAESYMAKLEASKVSGRTYNAALSLLRGAFERLRVRAGLLVNPFAANLIAKEENTVHRQPFTLEEVRYLLETAAIADPPIHDLITTGLCTALRLGDACCLTWSSIDLNAGVIRVKSMKTGEPVFVPILPLLRRVLDARRAGTAKTDVFPEFAGLYRRDPKQLHERLNRVFALAGFRPGPDDHGEPEKPPAPPPPVPATDEHLRREGLAKLRHLGDEDVSPRVKDLMTRVFDLYTSGMVVADIANELGISKGSVSNYLTRISECLGYPIIRTEIAELRIRQKLPPPPKTEPELPPREHGKIRVNARGFHALRATFTTQALAAGIPVETVRLITGHTTTEMILKHYFRPDSQMILDTLRKALPHMLSSGPHPAS